jgi:uncharacterized protein YecE (DUF72 family)
LPRAVQHRFPGADAHLARYARVFAATEINASFHRTPRPSTYARWSASVPASFRFAVKLPRSLTHGQRLETPQEGLDAFLASIAPLGAHLGCLLVQLPPALALARAVADAFFASLRTAYTGDVALEGRHPSWFTADAAALLGAWHVARVRADPPRVAAPASAPAVGVAYWRLHGSPRTYYSAYTPAFLDALASEIAQWRAHAGDTARAWCIFDNTASGAAASDALALEQRLQHRAGA